MLLNPGRLQLGSTSVSRLMKPRERAMMGARDRLIVDGRECKEFCAPAALIFRPISPVASRFQLANSSRNGNNVDARN